MKKESRLRSTLGNMAAALVNLVLGLGTGIIISRALGPSLKGEYNSLKLIITLYTPFLTFGYTAGVLYYGIRKQIDLQRFFWVGFFLMTVLGVLLIPVFFPLVTKGYLGSIGAESASEEIFTALLAVPLIYMNSYSERVIQSYNLFIASNVRVVLGGLITFFYYLIVWVFFSMTLMHALYGFVFGQLFQVLSNLYFIIKFVKVRWRLSFKPIFKPWRYGIQGWLNRIIAMSNDKFDQIILTFQLSSGAFGIYTVGVGLSNLVTQLPNSYGKVFFNQIAETDNVREALVIYARAQRVTFIITLIISLCLAVVAYPLILVLYGSEFLAAAAVVFLYAPGVVFQVAAKLSIRFYAGQGKPLKNSLVYLIGILVSLPFYFWLVPLYGINGAAIASSIAYLTAFMFSFYQIHREFGVRLYDLLVFKKDDWYYIRVQLAKLPRIGKYFHT